ncbi:MAG: FmdE family protein [Syntrophobacteraceae bacterium]
MHSNDNKEFQTLLAKAVAFHGHLCGGQIIGVKMAMAGLREVGINDPKGADRKDLIVLVEIDRCATDAIITATGCRVGRRSLKVLDYGKMAATFVNMKTGKAVRINATAESRRRAEELEEKLIGTPGVENAFCEALLRMSEEELFRIREVSVHLKPQDLPGEPLDVVICEECGETVLDMREVEKGGRLLCRTCADGTAYYAPMSA